MSMWDPYRPPGPLDATDVTERLPAPADVEPPDLPHGPVDVLAPEAESAMWADSVIFPDDLDDEGHSRGRTGRPGR